MSDKYVAGEIKVSVDTSELDAAIEKAKVLNELTKPVEYKIEQEIDSNNVTDPIDSARYAMKYIQDIYGPDKKDKLLVIELDDIDAVPKIVFNGKQVESFETLGISWEATAGPNRLTGVSYDHSDKGREISVVYGD